MLRSIASAKNLQGKVVLVRIDTNVPLSGKHILDDSRLRQVVPTIRLLERKGAGIILIGHLGRPGGKAVANLSLKPVGYALGKILRQPVKVLPHTKSAEEIKRQAGQGIVMLENIRFLKGEDSNSQELAKWLARLGNLYVNEAFSCSHRAAASLVALPRKLPAFAGLSLIHEVESLERVRKSGAKPVVAIIGGAKIGDKLPVIEKLLPRLSVALTGGGVANTFLKARGYKVGDSLVDKTEVKEAKRLLKKFPKKIMVPLDVVVDMTKTKLHEAWLKRVEDIGNRDKIVDIGTESSILYAKHIKKAATIFWGGPLGQVEEENWRHSTLALGRLASSVAKRRTYVVVGGGETVGFFHQYGLEVDFFSTGGGAMLEFLAGIDLPGISVLNQSRK